MKDRNSSSISSYLGGADISDAITAWIWASCSVFSLPVTRVFFALIKVKVNKEVFNRFIKNVFKKIHFYQNYPQMGVQNLKSYEETSEETKSYENSFIWWQYKQLGARGVEDIFAKNANRLFSSLPR